MKLNWGEVIGMAFKIVVSDPETRRAWQVEKEADALIGLSIGDRFDGSIIGLTGYTLEITGGSDKDGFPMRSDIPGTGRRKLLLSGGVGYRPKEKHIRRRKSVRGKKISEDISQVNVKVVEKKKGAEEIPKLLGLEGEEKPEEEKKEG